jgi:hypothetical protein
MSNDQDAADGYEFLGDVRRRQPGHWRLVTGASSLRLAPGFPTIGVVFAPSLRYFLPHLPPPGPRSLMLASDKPATTSAKLSFEVLARVPRGERRANSPISSLNQSHDYRAAALASLFVDAPRDVPLEARERQVVVHDATC